MDRTTREALLRQLKNPFDPRFVKFRIGATTKDKTKGIALAYIDAREVMKRLDEVLGIDGWSNTYKTTNDGLICELSIRLDDKWVTKSSAANDTKVEPVKGASSDSFKRAAAMFGVGRYLYYLPNTWVAIKPMGKSYTLAETPELPDWAQPDYHLADWESVAEMQADMQGSEPHQDVSAKDELASEDVKQAIIRVKRGENGPSA